MFTDPVKNLKALGLAENMLIADLGAGSGFYTLAAAQLVPQGRVYALEIQADFLTSLRTKVKEARLENVECILADIEKRGGTKIADAKMDRVILSNVLFQVEDKEGLVEEIKRILKKDGKILLIDWQQPPLGVGQMEILSKEKAKNLFEAKGFAWQNDLEVGSYHYGMILKKI